MRSVFLLVGLLGFVPGITTHYGDLGAAGHQSTAKLLDSFQVSVLHNIVHLLFGIARWCCPAPIRVPAPI